MFNKIVIINPVLITKEGKEELRNICNELVEFDTYCDSDEEAINRIGNADCLLVSNKSILNENILRNCNDLKFVCMCCSYYGKEFTKVDINYLENNNIKYSYLKGHGDNGVVEYTLSQVISLIHGFNNKEWKTENHDLTGIKVGILGLGELGYKIAKSFNALDTTVYYFSKTRKENLENDKLIYLEIEELLKTVDIISINLNRDTCLIGSDRLDKFGNNKIIVNTSIGYCYEKDTLLKWLENKNNYYICDKASTNEDLFDVLGYENVIYIDKISGDTKECYERATVQILNNLNKYLKAEK